MGRYENGNETRRVIYNAAKWLFFHKGYNKTTFDDIAAAAHVNRGSVYYHFKTKSSLRDAIIREVHEKSLYIARYIGVEQAYIYPIGFSICIYYTMTDPDFERFTVTGLLPKIRNYDKGEDFSSLRLDCFLPFLTPGEMDEISLDPWNEYSLHILDLNLYYLVSTHHDQFTLDEVMKNFVYTVGKIYMVPKHSIEEAWGQIHKIIQNIDYDKLHIRW